MTLTRRDDLLLELVALGRERRTGILQVEAAGVHTLIYFQDGRPVFAEQGTHGDTLGRVLVEQGGLTQAQYAQVIEHMTRRLVDSEEMRFGEAAIELGILSPHLVYEGLATQVRRKLVGCLQWGDARYVFRDDPDALDEVAHFPCDFDSAVIEAVRAFFEPERLEPILRPWASHYLTLTQPVQSLAERLRLSAPELRISRALDGTRTLTELRREHASLEPAASRLLAALLSLGRVEARSAPPTERSPQPAPAAKRGAPTSGEAPAAKRAAPTSGEAPAATRGPSGEAPHRDPSPRAAPATEGRSAGTQPSAPQTAEQRDEARRRLEQMARGARGARRVPTARSVARSSRPPSDERQARLQAEQLFEKACQHLDRGAFVPAATDFRRAVKRAPDVPEYELHARFAEYRAAGEAERHARLEALEEALQTALKRDRRFAFAHYVFGMLALWRGDDERALSAFDRAVRLGAPLLDAERHRRLLSKRLGKGSRR